MSLAKLKEKYDYRKPQAKIVKPDPEPEHTHELKSWKDSAPVSRLIEYLEMNEDKGMMLYKSDGRVGLKFVPGINREDLNNGRMKIATNTYELLCDAGDDLDVMITQGIEIPKLTHDTQHPWQRKAAGTMAGPSRRS